MPRRRNANRKVSCFIIGFIHLVVVGASIYERLCELVALEEPFQMTGDRILVFLMHVLEIGIVCLLIRASCTDNANAAIPWLLTITPFFCIATLYAVLYAGEEEWDQALINFFVVGLVWLSWYMVLRFFLENRRRHKR